MLVVDRRGSPHPWASASAALEGRARDRGQQSVRRDVVVWSWVFFLYLFLAAPDVRGQPSQAEGGHASHHGGADPTGPSEGSADGASSEELAADRRGGMRGAQPTPLFSQMLDAEGATPVGRARIRDRAERLMLAGAQEMSAGIAEMNAATSSDDQFAMRKAALRLHQGAQQLEAGLVALDALSQAAVPREAAMRWFQENLGLRSPVPSDRPATGSSRANLSGFGL